MDKYSYSPGPSNKIYEELVLSIAKTLGEQGIKHRIFGSTALFILQKMFGGEKYKYIQTTVRNNRTGDERTCVRDLDILLEVSGRSVSDVRSTMDILGNFEPYNDVGDLYKPFIDRNKGIINLVRGKLSLTENLGLNVSRRVCSQIVERMYGKVELTVDIVVAFSSCVEDWHLPSMSKNFWVCWSPEANKFHYGCLSRNTDNGCDDPLVLNHAIASLVQVEYWNNPQNINKHTPSGDPISPKTPLPPGLEFDEFNFNLEKRIRHVLEGKDYSFTSYLTFNDFSPYLYLSRTKSPVLKELLRDNCTICQGPLLGELRVFKTKCCHIFHSACIAKYIKNYYVAVMKASLAKKICSITLYNIRGDVIASDNQAKCPNCRESVFKVDIPIMRDGMRMQELKIKESDLCNSPFKKVSLFDLSNKRL